MTTPSNRPTSEQSGPDSLSFPHRYLSPDGAGAPERYPTLLLLHGTGGDEDDLIPLGRALLPGAGLLSPRGQVLEHGAARFFRRHAEGVFDLDDLARRTDDLARFIDAAATVYKFERSNVIGVGFSNGANIAGSLLLKRGAVMRAAILFSPMVPFEPSPTPHLDGVDVFIGAGRMDPMVPAIQVKRLEELMISAGARVTTHWEMAGHTLTANEVAVATEWLRKLVG
jgi:phospholipase/carboxylesterase